MIDLIVAAALDMQRLTPRDISDCRPRQHLLRSAPPPPAFSIERFQSPSQERLSLSAFRCPDGVNWRVNRYPSEAIGRDYVLGTACPEIVQWIEAVRRLPIPNASLTALGETPRAATWFVLRADHVTGGGYHWQMELTLIERENRPPDPIAIWAREGEAVFARCHRPQAEPEQ